MKTMFWHGGGGLDILRFSRIYSRRKQPKNQTQLAIRGLRLFPEFLLEQVRQLAYCSALGQFLMSEIFSPYLTFFTIRRFSRPQVVEHIGTGLVEQLTPITYAVTLEERVYEIIPESAGLTFCQMLPCPT